ncbi:MAG: CYTH domain-containing protein, partial [Verrucomicrobiaceae bacterium]
MAVEIERKFLVADDRWRAEVTRVTSIRQGYLSHTSSHGVRIRIFGDQGFITFKSEPGK